MSCFIQTLKIYFINKITGNFVKNCTLCLSTEDSIKSSTVSTIVVAQLYVMYRTSTVSTYYIHLSQMHLGEIPQTHVERDLHSIHCLEMHLEYSNSHNASKRKST